MTTTFQRVDAEGPYRRRGQPAEAALPRSLRPCLSRKPQALLRLRLVPLPLRDFYERARSSSRAGARLVAELERLQQGPFDVGQHGAEVGALRLPDRPRGGLMEQEEE